MGYSMKDLERASRNLNRRMEERSRQRGEELANKVINNTAAGRGLWVIILWPAWLLIALFSGMFFSAVLEKIGLGSPLTLLGILIGIGIATFWYKADYTKRRPFWSSVIFYFGISLSIVFLSPKLGISL